MPFSLMLRAARDLLFKEHLPGESFEADIVNTYGRTLYDIFFKPYTRKFLFHSPAELHRDWARAGVNRAVIDKRARSDSLWSLLKTTLMPKPVETMFLYPPHGVGRFSDLLAEGVRQVGGRILTDTTVTAVETARNRVTAVRTQTSALPATTSSGPRHSRRSIASWASTTSISSTSRRFSTTSRSQSLRSSTTSGRTSAATRSSRGSRRPRRS